MTTSTRARDLVVMTGLLIGLSACADSEPPQRGDDASSVVRSAVDTATPAATATPTAPTTALTTAPLSATAALDVDGSGAAEYVVDGVPVRTLNALEQLPERATVLRNRTTITDDGTGPRMCMLISNDSFPPRCEGPFVDGLQMQEWADSKDGVRFGGRIIEFTWPPVDNHVMLIAEYPAESRIVPQPPRLEPGSFSGAELDATQAALLASMLRGDLYIDTIGTNEASGRVEVYVMAADQETVRELGRLVDDPAALVVVGSTEIIDGT